MILAILWVGVGSSGSRGSRGQVRCFSLMGLLYCDTLPQASDVAMPAGRGVGADRVPIRLKALGHNADN